MDSDAFYYSVECLRDPSLRGKPVIVAGLGPRAVVTTASYEARRYGIGSAMPAARAQRLCPQAIIVAPHGDLYRAKSREMWEIVSSSLGCKLQHVSLDEAYVDLSQVPSAVERLRAVVAEVRQQTGITISVGVGPNRLVAKCSSDLEKPEGFVVLTRAEACQRFASASPGLIPGIGPKTVDRLLGLGIGTINHLQSSSAMSLREEFSERVVQELKARASFYDDSPVVTSRAAKSKSNETSYDVDVSEMSVLESTLGDLAEELCAQLQAKQLSARTIGIKVRLNDWTTITRARTIRERSNDATTIKEICLQLLREYAPQRPVRLLGVRVASFTDDATTPAPASTPMPKETAKSGVPEQLLLPFAAAK